MNFRISSPPVAWFVCCAGQYLRTVPAGAGARFDLRELDFQIRESLLRVALALFPGSARARLSGFSA